MSTNQTKQKIVRKCCPVTHNNDLDMFIEREAVMIEEQMHYRKKKDDETIEFLIKRGVIYRER